MPYGLSWRNMPRQEVVSQDFSLSRMTIQCCAHDITDNLSKQLEKSYRPLCLLLSCFGWEHGHRRYCSTAYFHPWCECKLRSNPGAGKAMLSARQTTGEKMSKEVKAVIEKLELLWENLESVRLIEPQSCLIEEAEQYITSRAQWHGPEPIPPRTVSESAFNKADGVRACNEGHDRGCQLYMCLKMEAQKVSVESEGK